MTTTRRPRLAPIAAVMAAAILLLAACGNADPGTAATVGDTRISEQALGDQVQAILTAQGQPVTTADEALTSQTLGRMITLEVVDRLAKKEGISVTQGQIDEQMAAAVAQTGDMAALEKVYAEQGIAPSQIESFVTLNIQAQQLGISLLPEGSAEQQGQAVFDAAVALSEELDTTVSPRFGVWDASRLGLGPAPDDLSTPPSLS
jgi:SurA N-terminal domain